MSEIVKVTNVMNNSALRIAEQLDDSALKSAVISEGLSAHRRREHSVAGTSSSYEGNRRTVLRNYDSIETMLKKTIAETPPAARNALKPQLDIFLEHKARLEKIYSDA